MHICVHVYPWCQRTNTPRYVSFGDSQGNTVPGHSDWTVVLRTGDELLPDHLHTYTFTIRNPLQTSVASSHTTSDIIAAAPAGSSIQGMPYHKSFQYQESAAYTIPPNLGLRVVRQSNAMPGELNNISFLFRPSSTVLPNSRLVIEGLLDSNLLFARTTHEKCAGSMRDGITNVAAALPFVDAAIPQAGTGPAVAGVSAGAAAGNRVHTAWSQELHADGQLRLFPCVDDADSCEQPHAFFSYADSCEHLRACIDNGHRCVQHI